MGILHASNITPTSSGIRASLNSSYELRIDIAEHWLVRVAVVPVKGLSVDRTWMIAPEKKPPVNGRNRLSLQNFSCPEVSHQENIVSTDKLRIGIETTPLRLRIEQLINGQWQTLCHDRENGAYQWLAQRHSFRHFQTIDRSEQHFGLGDKSGPLDRTRRRFTCLQTDALGYDAEHSDPLYKHAPFFISQQPGQPAFGVLYDTFSEVAFDFGCEHSNYFEPFRQIATQEEGLIYYIIAGPEIRDVVPRLHQLTGMPAMPPRWSMGFAFSAMAHTDSAHAQNTIINFAHTMREKKLPISALHLGSGYTQKDNGCRYVFNWNTDKFPQRNQFFHEVKALGLHTCANVKPVLLDDHDSFAAAKRGGWFVSRADGSPAIERFWDGAGAQLDFTHPDATNFWDQGISSQVLGAGFDSVWNDNNEAELWDETATIHGYGQALNGMLMRPVHALQMMRTSFEAIQRHTPDKRPYNISRAGPIGIARYGETWSGDNETSWHSLKWNLRQGLSMSLSGFPITGHDIGGFSGPSPTPELLVRWFQMMALHPRAVMNSWKPDESLNTNLPFMYDTVTGLVREALELRYRFLPYLYAVTWQTHQTGHPIIRPLFYDYPDPDCFTDQDTFLLGPDVLVAPATEENQQQHRIYLPVTKGGWINFHNNNVHQGGQWLEINTAPDLLPIFIRSGSILPLAASWDIASPHNANTLQLNIYPDDLHGQHAFTLLWDDGESTTPEHHETEITLTWDTDSVTVKVNDRPDIPVNIHCPTLGSRQLIQT
ncbi:MAG: TIM-barrel domain-containing protein [Thiolinea sp.]